MFRILFIILIVVVLVTSVIGVDPSCTLILGAHSDPCQAGQSETLTQHLAHATNTFPELFLTSTMALIVCAALVMTVLTRTALLPVRDVRLSPEQPPRFA